MRCTPRYCFFLNTLPLSHCSMAARFGARALSRVLGASTSRAASRSATFSVVQRSLSAVPHISDKIVHVTFSNNAGLHAVAEPPPPEKGWALAFAYEGEGKSPLACVSAAGSQRLFCVSTACRPAHSGILLMRRKSQRTTDLRIQGLLSISGCSLGRECLVSVYVA
jgi:hypothetical protein